MPIHSHSQVSFPRSFLKLYSNLWQSVPQTHSSFGQLMTLETTLYLSHSELSMLWEQYSSKRVVDFIQANSGSVMTLIPL